MKKLQTIQNDCLRIVNNIHDAREANVNDLHVDATLDKLQARRNKQLLIYMYRRSKDDNNLLQPARVLRGNDKPKFKLRRPIKNCYVNSPEYRGSRLWDRLTAAQQASATKNEFVKNLTPHDLRVLERLII